MIPRWSDAILQKNFFSARLLVNDVRLLIRNIQNNIEY